MLTLGSLPGSTSPAAASQVYRAADGSSPIHMGSKVNSQL